MIEKINKWLPLITLVIVVIIAWTLVGGNNQSAFGAGTRFPNGVSADSTSPVAGEVRGSTLTITGAVVTNELTQGGSILATSTSGTATVLKASDLLTYSVLEVTPNTADLTYTFPAVASLATLVPTAGDSRTWTIYNATTTAGIDVIFAAGSGMETKGVGGAALTIDEASFGTITLVRKASGDLLLITAFPTAD